MSKTVAAIPITNTTQKQYVFPHFGKAPAFAIVEIDDSSYRVISIVENKYASHEQGHGHTIINELVNNMCQQS